MELAVPTAWLCLAWLQPVTVFGLEPAEAGAAATLTPAPNGFHVIARCPVCPHSLGHEVSGGMHGLREADIVLSMHELDTVIMV